MALCIAAASAQTPALLPYQIEGGEIRESGNCYLCHTVPDAGTVPVGNIGPSLAGVGARASIAQLRLRIVDSARINARSVMPAYYRIEGLQQVAAAYRDKPLLTAQQVEDVVAYLAQLQN